MTVLLTETPDQITRVIRMAKLMAQGHALCQEKCSKKFTKLERGLMRPSYPWPFCTHKEKPNFADFQRKIPHEI